MKGRQINAQREERLEYIDLREISHRGNPLFINATPFSCTPAEARGYAMEKGYTHSKALPKVSFRFPTSNESISIMSVLDREDGALPPLELIKGFGWGSDKGFYLTHADAREEGLYLHSPDIDTYECIDKFQQNEKIVGGVRFYTGQDIKNLALVPWGTYTRGLQTVDTFVRGGLARALEHSEGDRATNLEKVLRKFGIKKVDVGKEPPKRENVFPSFVLLDVDNEWDEENPGYYKGKENSVLNVSFPFDLKSDSKWPICSIYGVLKDEYAQRLLKS